MNCISYAYSECWLQKQVGCSKFISFFLSFFFSFCFLACLPPYEHQTLVFFHSLGWKWTAGEESSN